MKPFLKYITITISLISLVFVSFHLKKAPTTRPNIIYILADDLGYGDVSCYNASGKINTPNIDQLAAEGIRFTDMHSPSGVCTPTRYGIITGEYPWRSKLPVGVLRGYSRNLIDPAKGTVADLLKKYHYETAVVGKWHLGIDWDFSDKAIEKGLGNVPGYGIQSEMDTSDIAFNKKPTFGPNDLGFNYSYILPASLDMPPYCYLENHQLTSIPSSFTPGNKLESGYTGPFWRAGKMSPDFDFYEVLPTFINKAKAFILHQKKDKPFFLYLPLAAPHTPWVPKQEYVGSSKAGEYGDFTLQVDAAVGEILKVLKEKGMDKNTMVIFTSDNGPYWRENFTKQFQHRAAGPFRGMKGDAYEGGHRIPFIVRWPAKIKKGTVSNAIACQTSLLSTLRELLSDNDPAFIRKDSYSILPDLLGSANRSSMEKPIIHSSSRGFFAIRSGEWKLIDQLGSGGFTAPEKEIPTPGGPTVQLYHLKSDPSEKENVALKYPEITAKLLSTLAEIKK
jgi:arylsulfatase A-like enzyme